ncbi:hypothetical protein CLOM_g3696 [Closterium sp. NIES-68]|nr:hypothetical protein CLOM_g3696 [Closterium sp. NIES-68]
MGALGGDNQEERNVGDDQGEQVLGNPVPGLVLGALGGGVQEQGSVGEQRQQQQQQQQGRGQASGLQLTQLRMSRGTRLIEELEVDGDLLAAAAKRGAFLPHSLRVLSVTPSPAVAPSFLPQTVRLDVSSLASISLRVLKISGVYLSTRGNSALGSGCDACFFPNLLLLELRGVQTWHGKGLKKPLVKLARLARSASPFSNFRHQLLQHCPNLQILHMDSLPHSSPLPVLRSLGVLVIGSYADSGASLASLSQFVSLHTLRFNGIPSGVSGVLGGTISCPPNLQRLQICAQGITHLPRFTWKFTTITQLDLINFSKLKTSPEDVYSRFPSLQCLRVDGLRR